MSLATEPWSIDRHDRVAKIARSLSQDVGRKFKEDVLGRAYPEKKITNNKGEEVDIGKICCDWAYIVLTDFDSDKKMRDTLLRIIRLSYIDGIDLNCDDLWLDYISVFGVGSFSDKVNKFAQIARLSFMDKLDKKKKGRSISDVQW